MHIESCISPKTIWNSYLKELQVVPCGKCSACINRKATVMVTRLNVEAQCHPYTLFCTLTYDNEHLPVLSYRAPYLTDLSPLRVHPKLGIFNVDIEEELHQLHTSREENAISFEYIKRCQTLFGGLPYLSSVDIQRFFKRLRSNISRNFKKQFHNETIIPKIRYYAAGEYGPSTFRCHWHLLLFIDSEWLAQNVVELVRESWKFGFVDASFVEHNASDYVAKYLNCLSSLPAVYRTRSLHPFSLYSKHPALGTLLVYSDTLKKLFLAETLYQTIFDSKNSVFKNVPFWRSIQHRLYPRISFFDFVDPRCLCRLYSTYSRYERSHSLPEFYSFRRWVESERKRCQYLDKYLDLLASYRGDYEKKLQRLYLVSKSVCYQAQAWNIDVDDYTKAIIKYYNTLKEKNLSDWYRFCEEYTKSHECGDLIGIDPLFLRQFQDCDISELTAEEFYYIQSFGVDMEKFFSTDPVERLAYQSKFYPCNTQDFKDMKMANDRILDNSTKTKRKNDYQNSASDWYHYITVFGYDGQKRNVEDFDIDKFNVLPKFF